MKKHALRLLGLSLLVVLGLMAMGASAAQAEMTELLVEGKTLAELTEVEMSLEINEPGGLLTKSGVEIHCEKGKGTANVKATGTTVEGKATGLFSNCTTPGQEHCIVEESLTNPDHAIAASGIGRVILDANHPGEYFLLVEGLEMGGKKVFSEFVVKDDGTEECLMVEAGEPATHFQITGSTVIKLDEPEVEAAEHIGLTLELGLFPGDTLFLGAEEAHLTPGLKGHVKLAGTHANQKFSLMMLP